jgi:hypothetical protein
MSILTIEFPLPPGAATVKGGKLRIELGNNVHLTTEAPAWLQRVITTQLHVVMEVEGSPHDKPSPTPIK